MVDIQFATAYPKLLINAAFKQQPDDFIVTEKLPFTPEGEGEHVFVYIEKKLINTVDVVQDIAKQTGVAQKHIAYSGLKDKQAKTRQWFSFAWPIKQEIPELSGDNWQVLEVTRHVRKLKRGTHQQNDFEITLRDIEPTNKKAIEQRLALIAKEGVPNYFGPQRFGFSGNNITKALALFSGAIKMRPNKRSIYFSAARSYLFNHYLQVRIKAGIWNQYLEGDTFMLDGSQSVFTEKLDEQLANRLKALDIHPVGVMHGEGGALTSEAQALWQQCLQAQPALCEGLLKFQLKSAYRALRLWPKSLNWQWQNNNTLTLSLTLPAGTFATAVLHELFIVNETPW